MANKYKKKAAELKAQAARLMNREQQTKCNIAIHTASIASAAYGALPIMGADAIPISATQITMVISLGKIFDMKLTESAAKGLIKAATSTIIGRNLVKIIPIVGSVVSATVAASITEAVGWSVAVDFAKKAKTRWEEDNCPIEDEVPSELDTEDESIHVSDDDIDNMIKRANEFISGEKTRSVHENEFSALLTDIEKVLIDLPQNHPLRKSYRDLSQIIE